MDSKKLERIISIIKEQMVANAPGGSGGVSDETNPTGKDGPAGFSPVIKFNGRSKIARRLPPPYRTDLINKKKKNQPPKTDV